MSKFLKHLSLLLVIILIHTRTILSITLRTALILLMASFITITVKITILNTRAPHRGILTSGITHLPTELTFLVRLLCAQVTAFVLCLFGFKE